MKRLLLGLTMAWVAGTAYAASPEWALLWSDEFDRPGAPDGERWGYEHGYVRNREAQYYTRDRRENARIEDGCLVIEARKDNWQNRPITSASLTTETTALFRYVRVEVRAKVPTGRGTWPAIWMLGRTHRTRGWPACGEIDIMEHVGFNPDVIHGTVHTKAYNHVRGTAKGSTIRINAPHEDFHVYAIDWNPERIDFYVDEKKYFTFANEGSGRDAWPFDEPAYLLLNLAIGGSWGAQKGIDESLLPHRYLIDYVRVYRPVARPAAECLFVPDRK